MYYVLIRKRFVLAAFLGLLGLALLVMGWRGVPGQTVKKEAGIPASAPATGKVEMGGTGTAGTALDLSRKSLESSKEGSAFFVEYRLDRERTRGQQVELLREIVNSPSTAAETRRKAQEKLLTISQNMAREMEVENLIRARGFQDAAVCLDEKGATVVVLAPRISKEEAARINELVSRGTGVDARNVVIIPRP
ncbi:MAG TPA: SpoIIIAH-like family protein [Desulfotomaculum sp.]|nr:SpoIIIAH-like family protein [Desulfotomaculum sp.]